MVHKRIGLAADHGGFRLKCFVIEQLRETSHEVLDFGTFDEDAVDYPDFAKKLVAAIKKKQIASGILMCGTGIGISIAANRHKGVRAALCHDENTARLSRLHNDANILCLGGRTTSKTMAADIVRIFFETEFEGGRHTRRITKLG